MIPALLAIASSGSLVGGIVIGAAWMRQRKPTSGCPHAWGEWEDCQLRSHWRWNANRTEYIPVLVDGQKRVCTICREKEIRKVEL